MYYTKLALVLILGFSYICSKAQLNPSFNPIPASFGVTSPNPLIATDIVYSQEDTLQQAFHLLLPDTAGSYPLVIYIHGGGFQGGSRDVLFSSTLVQATAKYFLDQGIAFACIGYRLLPTSGPTDPDGVKKCMGDAKRALQFMRYHAPNLYLSPQYFAVTGSSAGAGTSLWLATRNDMADPNSNDPIEQTSTRVCAAYLKGSQSTYDLYRWETEVYQNFDLMGSNYTLDSMEALIGFDRYASFYGGLDSTYHILYDSALIQYRQDVDMLYHMSSDDPPIYIASSSLAVHPSQDLMHHSLHSNLLFNTAVSANISDVKANIQALNIDNTQNETGDAFLLRHLNNCAILSETRSVEQHLPLRIWPNPATNFIQIEKPAFDQIATIKLFSIQGQLILTKDDCQLSPLSIALDGLKSGLYIVHVTDLEGRISTQKLRIQAQ
jgi:hypothetical protein